MKEGTLKEHQNINAKLRLFVINLLYNYGKELHHSHIPTRIAAIDNNDAYAKIKVHCFRR